MNFLEYEIQHDPMGYFMMGYFMRSVMRGSLELDIKKVLEEGQVVGFQQQYLLEENSLEF